MHNDISLLLLELFPVIYADIYLSNPSNMSGSIFKQIATCLNSDFTFYQIRLIGLFYGVSTLFGSFNAELIHFD